MFLLQVSSEIFDLCEMSDLFLHVSNFAFQSNAINFGDEVFDVCCEIENFS